MERKVSSSLEVMPLLLNICRVLNGNLTEFSLRGRGTFGFLL